MTEQAAELRTIAERLRNYAAAPTEDLREIADRLDVLAGEGDAPDDDDIAALRLSTALLAALEEPV